MRMSSFKMVFHWNPPSHRNLSIPTWCRHVRGENPASNLIKTNPWVFFLPEILLSQKKAGVQSHGDRRRWGSNVSPRWFFPKVIEYKLFLWNPTYWNKHPSFLGEEKTRWNSATSNGYHGGFRMNQFVCSLRNPTCTWWRYHPHLEFNRITTVYGKFGKNHRLN